MSDDELQHKAYAIEARMKQIQIKIWEHKQKTPEQYITRIYPDGSRYYYIYEGSE